MNSSLLLWYASRCTLLTGNIYTNVCSFWVKWIAILMLSWFFIHKNGVLLLITHAHHVFDVMYETENVTLSNFTGIGLSIFSCFIFLFSIVANLSLLSRIKSRLHVVSREERQWCRYKKWRQFTKINNEWDGVGVYFSPKYFNWLFLSVWPWSGHKNTVWATLHSSDQNHGARRWLFHCFRGNSSRLSPLESRASSYALNFTFLFRCKLISSIDLCNIN